MKNKFLLILLSLICVFCFANQNVEIAFFHDIHSFLDETPKVKTLLDAQFEKNPNTFVFDAGDFSMGTLYQSIYKTQAAELNIMGKLGIDATTLGNHEFDYGAEGLKEMLDSANNQGGKIPAIVLCNVNTEKENDYTKTLKKSFESYIKDYVVIEKGGIKIAVFGVFGTDAFFSSPTCELEFLDQYESAKNIVNEIKANENVDMIVCLSHCGTNSNPKKSEDEILAKKVPEIDLIISGHSHTTLEKPITIKNTHIVSSGAYLANLGYLELAKSENNRWEIKDYQLIKIDENVKSNEEFPSVLAKYEEKVDDEFLSIYGLSKNQVLTRLEKTTNNDSETGYLMAKAFSYSLENLNLVDKTPTDITVVPNGVIRGNFTKNEVTVSDVFTNFSLGIGPDNLAGYPLVTMYLYPSEIKAACEIDCSLGKIQHVLQMYIHGVGYEYNSYRLPFNQVSDCFKINQLGEKELLENNKLYKVVADMYTAKMIGNVLDMTKGLIKIVPKKANGEPIQKFEDEIVYYYTENGEKRELKGWYAIVNYFENADEIADFREIQNNAVIKKNSLNPIQLVKNPSTIGMILYAVIGLLIIGITFIVIAIVKRKKNHKKLGI